MRLPLLLASATFALTAADPSVTFLRDVAPILNKTSCTSGPCHGAAKGKNGFKLSLRGYDPQFDYEALLYDLSGRRFNRAEPARSLMLAKPTQSVAHGGGLRFDKKSPYYTTIYNWIAQGVPFGDPAKDTVTALEVEPREVAMAAPGATSQVKVTARFADGQTRDVTREATIESNSPTVAKVDAASLVSGERVGEATLLVRYQGKYSTIPVQILNPKPGFAWKPLPQNNYIDQHIDAKLQKLKIQPSPVTDDSTFLRRVTVDLTGQLPSPDDVRAFLADPAPSKVKRDRKIDKLVGSPAFVDHWTVKWSDLLQSSRKFLGEKGTYGFREWIRESIGSNKPYDKMVRELLTSRGSTYDDPAGKVRGGPYEYGSHSIHSDDGGKTWQLGGILRPKVNECQVVELHDNRGTLLMDMRSYFGRSRRSHARSTDGGKTWSAHHDAEALVEPVCQASIVRHEPGLLLFSNPADPKTRVRLTVKASADDAKTWREVAVLHEGPSAYSSLVSLDTATAGCLYERGEKRAYEKITFARFPVK